MGKGHELRWMGWPRGLTMVQPQCVSKIPFASVSIIIHIELPSQSVHPSMTQYKHNVPR